MCITHRFTSLFLSLPWLLAACAPQPAQPAAKQNAEPAAGAAALLAADTPVDWSARIANIEACSCPAFCQCYVTGQPALHLKGEGAAAAAAKDVIAKPDAGADAGRAERYCRFNNAFLVKDGHWGDTKLDGVKFWMAGDLGPDFSKGQMDWAVLHFEPSATPDQRKALQAIVQQIFPVRWRSFTVGQDLPIDWRVEGDRAAAKLNDGHAAEIALKQVKNAAGQPVMIENVQFWAAPRNDGFRVMRSEVEAYRLGDKPYEFRGTNGFVTTLEISSRDVAAAKANGSK